MSALPPRPAEVARLYRAQWTCRDIAAHLGIGLDTVYAHAGRARSAGVDLGRNTAGLGKPRRFCRVEAVRLSQQGETASAIAARFGVSIRAVSAALQQLREAGALLPPAPTRWTHARLQDAYALARAHGMPEAARRLGLRYSTLRTALCRHGLRLRDGAATVSVCAAPAPPPRADGPPIPAGSWAGICGYRI